MRISSNSLAESVYQLYQKNHTSAQPASFDDLLRAATGNIQNAAANGQSSGHLQAKFLDPNFEAWFQYKQWKSQQPERVLPDSQGATEENLAYLLENFSGELSLFQCIEVLDTMREMGIITEKQMDDALGLDFTLVTVDPNCTFVVGPLEGDYGMGTVSNSSVFEHPLTNAQYLDELFEILDRLLRGDGAEDLANDLREAFDRAKTGISGRMIAQCI